MRQKFSCISLLQKRFWPHTATLNDSSRVRPCKCSLYCVNCTAGNYDRQAQ